MELTNIQKIIGGIILLAIAGFAISMGIEDLSNKKAPISAEKQSIAAPLTPESDKK